MSTSLVLAHPAATAAQSADYLRAKLAFYTDASDLAHDLAQQVAGLVVIDVRTPDSYEAGHIPGAINLPHRCMDETSTAGLDRDASYIVYCDGIGCNGSTKGAYRLALLGFRVKELIGGLDWWKRDRYPVAQGVQPADAVSGAICGC